MMMMMIFISTSHHHVIIINIIRTLQGNEEWPHMRQVGAAAPGKQSKRAHAVVHYNRFWTAGKIWAIRPREKSENDNWNP